MSVHVLFSCSPLDRQDLEIIIWGKKWRNIMLGTMLPSHGPAQGDEECQLNLDYSFRPGLLQNLVLSVVCNLETVF